jgi:acetylornithine deacetylase
MKGALAAMVYALAALAGSPEHWRGRVTLALCADEEAGGTFGAAFLAQERRIGADVGLVTEPAGITKDWEYIYTGSRGECCFRIRVQGTQMHSSISDRLPSTNANVRAAELLGRMSRQLKFTSETALQGGATFTPGVLLQGGVYFGILPPLAEFACEVRVPPGMTQADVGVQLERFLEEERRLDPTLSVSWSYEPGPLGWIAPHTVPDDHPLVLSLQRAATSTLHREPPLGVFPAWTDARFFDEVGIPCLPAFGPGRLTEAHRPNEFVETAEVLAASKMYASAALGYLQTQPKGSDAFAGSFQPRQ